MALYKRKKKKKKKEEETGNQKFRRKVESIT